MKLLKFTIIGVVCLTLLVNLGLPAREVGSVALSSVANITQGNTDDVLCTITITGTGPLINTYVRLEAWNGTLWTILNGSTGDAENITYNNYYGSNARVGDTATLEYYYRLNGVIVSINNKIRCNATADGQGDQKLSSIGLVNVSAPPDNRLIITLNTPANETILDNDSANFSFTPVANNNFVNCSLYINGVWDKANESIILNNSANWINRTGFANQTLNWSVGCWATIQNISENFTLEIAQPYPVAPPEVSNETAEIVVPFIFENTPTNVYCINDSYLYVDFIVLNTLSNGTTQTFNRSKVYYCLYGCSNENCNKSTHETYLFYIAVFGGLLGLLLLILALAKRL